jgi:hypothetical protein
VDLRGPEQEGFERKVVEVTDETRTVMGVTCVVVKDMTRDWSPLDPGVAEHKHYAPGVGLLREEAVEGDSYRVAG